MFYEKKKIYDPQMIDNCQVYFPVQNGSGIREEEAHLHSSLKDYVTDGRRESQNKLQQNGNPVIRNGNKEKKNRMEDGQ